eukprot:TRINITY_DN21556_c0_g1_i1.p1 TRINITY_DN21556_c0_g1~~TRINITY_DN21556_c0_g1_i1.p1  ORF type:complete len:243 (+),score=63.00 TRINITY_DN21556_c0_g1_i1:48-731(+)
MRLCLLLAACGVVAGSFDYVGQGWCRDGAGLLMNYAKSWQIFTRAECESACAALDTDCAGYSFRQPQCVMFLSQSRELPAGWTQHEGTGATTITTTAEVTGTVCYRRVQDNSTEEPVATGGPGTGTPATPVPEGNATPPSSDADGVWEDPVVVSFVTLSLAVLLFAVACAAWVHRGLLPMAFDMSVELRRVGASKLPPEGAGQQQPKIPLDPMRTDELLAFRALTRQ